MEPVDVLGDGVAAHAIFERVKEIVADLEIEAPSEIDDQVTAWLLEARDQAR